MNRITGAIVSSLCLLEQVKIYPPLLPLLPVLPVLPVPLFPPLYLAIGAFNGRCL
jgi:hypothetical protein